ncbi:MAG: transcriptional regulator [Candidatus Altiarchaeales archaeon HGW-Altiarchaeales-1]|nr:MAG: transcriptional regulator [Candidatus Altiarchaeales archaeon HGW-Altiarchaeales-1]
MGINKCIFEETGKCPITEISNILAKRWVMQIMRELLAGNRRFNELQKSLKNISPRVLSERLDEMEKYGIIKRKIYAEVPVKVEYSLTEKGLELKDSLNALTKWWIKWELSNI